ncbi:MAG: hypothetical protein HWN65_08115 [Candidatus Helarchaeota archaeon]|nr:hypothetical protein [Candidatus Helarchaeota archaeon]
MRRINKVLHVSNQKHLIVRVAPNQINVLKIGQTVVTENLTKLGRIFDIFGPVNHPFVSIKLNPDIMGAENLVGEMIYSFEEKKSKKRKRNS